MIYLFIALALVTVHPHHHKPKVVEKTDYGMNVWELPELAAEPVSGNTGGRK